jgi:hypothetical protein
MAENLASRRMSLSKFSFSEEKSRANLLLFSKSGAA